MWVVGVHMSCWGLGTKVRSRSRNRGVGTTPDSTPPLRLKAQLLRREILRKRFTLAAGVCGDSGGEIARVVRVSSLHYRGVPRMSLRPCCHSQTIVPGTGASYSECASRELQQPHIQWCLQSRLEAAVAGFGGEVGFLDGDPGVRRGTQDEGSAWIEGV